MADEDRFKPGDRIALNEKGKSQEAIRARLGSRVIDVTDKNIYWFCKTDQCPGICFSLGGICQSCSKQADQAIIIDGQPYGSGNFSLVEKEVTEAS